MAKTEILFPTGRIVGGSLYKPKTTDAEGRPLVYKTGAQTGQPREDWYFALAIAKAGEQHWANTEWGAKIWAAGHAFNANAGNNPKFAWKIIDGDSQTPNTKGVKPCDREGYPGHWIIAFSSAFAPNIFNRDGTQRLTQENAVNGGDYVQVYGDVDGNGSQSQPGVFINHKAVALQGYGERISTGVDAAAVGFGQGALPPGASAVPVGGMAAPPAVPGAPAVPPTQVAPPPIPDAPATVAPSPVAPPAGTAVSAPNMPPPPAVAVTPNPGIMTGGIPPAPPAAPAAPVVPAGPQMTAKANGVTYEQFIASGWTDDTLRANGYIA